jgi:hypothetical protein
LTVAGLNKLLERDHDVFEFPHTYRNINDNPNNESAQIYLTESSDMNKEILYEGKAKK